MALKLQITSPLSATLGVWKVLIFLIEHLTC